MNKLGIATHTAIMNRLGIATHKHCQLSGPRTGWVLLHTTTKTQLVCK